jgi:flagellin
MSGIVLSASVRQNLLSLQSTAALLATTQNDLATGNKVNSALDNPTNFFTAAGLNNRASDIGNLLDSIGNGVQVLQAANTGITSLQSLVSSAQSIANQVLQTPVGYSTKSNITSAALTGATANNLLGSVGVATNASAAATTALTTITSTNSTLATSGTVTAGAFTAVNVSSAGSPTAPTVTGTTDLTAGLADPGSDQTFTINGTTVTLATSTGTGSGTAPTKNFTLGDIETAINADTSTTHVTASDDGAGHLILTSSQTGSSAAITTTGTAALFGIANTTVNGANAVPASESFSVTLDGGSAHTITLSAATVSTFTGAGGTLAGSASALTAQDVANIANYQINGNTTSTGPASVVGGKLTFTSGTTGTSSSVALSAVTTAGAASGSTGVTATSNTGAAATSGSALTFQVNGQNVTLAAGPSYTGAQVAAEINAQVSGVSASYSTGKLTITSTGTPGAADAVTINNFSTGDASQLGFAASASVTANGTDATGGLSGETLVIAATGGGTATNITFGTGTNQISTLNQLNAALAANNLQASISTTGAINIITSNDAASSTIGTITGTATAIGSAFANAVGQPPVLDPASQATRANLITQYNNVLQQINTTSQDSSFNGVNLLNGDTLSLVFDETGASKLSITGVTFNDAGLGLSTLTAGTDFLDSDSANAVLAQLDNASTTLRGEASALGSNLSIVEIRQDFNKNLINVLQTGASNLTLADPNEEAANSQALSTRQSIAVSALALANQSQQSVLQLLR